MWALIGPERGDQDGQEIFSKEKYKLWMWLWVQRNMFHGKMIERKVSRIKSVTFEIDTFRFGSDTFVLNSN